MDNLRGIALMTVSMLGFAIADAGIKDLSATLPLGQIMGVFGFGGTLILGLWTLSRGEALWLAEMKHPAVALRFVAEIVAALCMTFALALTSLSLVSAVLQAAPLVVTLGAAIWFKEPVGWRRWSAVLVGFAGVLILLQPWDAAFDVTAFLPLVAMAALATRDLATRAAPARLSTFQLSTIGFFAMIPAALIMQTMQPWPVWPTPREWMIQGAILCLGIAGYFALTAAMRIGDISTVAPFRYARLIFGMGLGIALFGERPDLPVYIGAAIVVASGLYTFLRERRLARAQNS